ncbi:MAG: hypothetical protein OXC18_23135 [Desulfurellaceae bacterium]|nr:hypothetical protein [Desulfurellaceae bacterium]
MPENVLATLQRVRVIHILVCLPWLVLLAWLAGVAWFLTDDAFISFRYVRNLLNGNGLVFNPGEYVEGYTNFLWILELTAIWGLFGIRPEQAAPWLSVVCTVGTIAAMLWWVARLPSLHHRGLVAWMALGLLGSSATFAVWTSGGGLETRQFTFFIVLAVICLGVHGNRRRGLLVASLSLAGAALTRPEGIMLAACCFGWFAVQRILTAGRLDRRDLLFLTTPFVALVMAHFTFRYGYYGEWLPNTYYAKHVRPWYESGFRYLVAAALETGLYVLIPLAFVALRERWRRWRDSSYALVLLCILVHMAYVMRIGGDHFEYRPLDFYWPLLAAPVATGIVHLGSWMTDGLRRVQRFGSYARWAGPWTCTIVLFVPVLFYVGAIQSVLLFKDDVLRPRPDKLEIELNEKNAGWLLTVPGMPAIVAISNDLRKQSARHYVGLRAGLFQQVTNERIAQWKDYEKVERGVIPDDALAAFASPGLPFYYLRDMKVIDIHGLADATVARSPVKRLNHERRIAHDRFPPPGYLQQRGVNFRPYPSASSKADALARANYALKIGPELWMPFRVGDHQWVDERFADRDLRAKNRFSLTDPAGNLFSINGHHYFHYVGEQFLGRFEHGGMDGWRVEDVAVTNHYRHTFYADQLPIFGHVGPGFLTSYHPGKGDKATGKAFSPEFTARADQSLAFLLAGGLGPDVGLRLLADGEEVAVWHGTGEWMSLSGERAEMFDLIVYPLSTIAGKRLQLQLFDLALSHGAHIMLDHVMLVRPRLALDKIIGSGKPIIRASYDMYINDNELIYIKDACSQDAADALFSLHWAPTDTTNLSDYWKEYGFNVLDFRLEEYGVKSDDKCVAVVALPEYDISRIKTGQFVYGQDKELVWLWRESVRFDE